MQSPLNPTASESDPNEAANHENSNSDGVPEGARDIKQEYTELDNTTQLQFAILTQKNSVLKQRLEDMLQKLSIKEARIIMLEQSKSTSTPIKNFVSQLSSRETTPRKRPRLAFESNSDECSKCNGVMVQNDGLKQKLEIEQSTQERLKKDLVKKVDKLKQLQDEVDRQILELKQFQDNSDSKDDILKQLQESIGKKDETFKQLQDEVENKRGMLRQLLKQLDESANKFEKLQSEVSQKDDIIKQLRDNVGKKDGEIKQFQTNLCNKEAENKSLQDQLKKYAELPKKLKELDEELKKAKQTREENQAKIARFEKQILTQETELFDKNAKILSFETSIQNALNKINTLDAHNKSLGDSVSAKTSIIANMKAKTQHHLDRIAELDKNNADLNSCLAIKNAKISELEAHNKENAENLLKMKNVIESLKVKLDAKNATTSESPTSPNPSSSDESIRIQRGNELLRRVSEISIDEQVSATTTQSQRGADFAELKKINAALKSELTAKNDQILVLQTQHKDGSDKILELEQRLKTKESELSAKVSQLSEAQTKSNVDILELKKINSLLNSQLTTKSKQLSALEAQQTDLDIVELEARLKQKENELTLKNAQVYVLETQQKADREEIIELKTRDNIFKDRSNQMETEIANLKTKLQNNLSKIARLEMSNNDFQNKSDQSTSTFSTLEKENQNLRIELSKSRTPTPTVQQSVTQPIVQQNVAQPGANATTSAEMLQASVEAQIATFIANGRQLAAQIKNQATSNALDEEFIKQRLQHASAQMNTMIRDLTVRAEAAKQRNECNQALEHIYTSIGIQMEGSGDVQRLAWLWNLAGEIFMKFECYTKAAECYENGAKSAPTYFLSFHNLAELNFKTDQFEKAKSYAETAVKLAPRYGAASDLLKKIEACIRK